MTIAINLATPGLANRIKTYISCLSRYDEVRTLKVADNYIFPNIKMATDEEYKNCDHYNDWRFHIEENEYDKRLEYEYIDLLYEKTPQYFIDKYLSIFKSLSINEDILKYIEEMDEVNEDCIGLHIRSWYCDRSSWHSNELFEKTIDALDKNKKIFLCSDNFDVISYFKTKYMDRLYTHEQKRYNHPHLAESGHNNDIQANVDAFIDMMLLSKCDTIVGTYASTFAEVSWWFGECKAKVIVPKPQNVSEEFHNRIFKKL